MRLKPQPERPAVTMPAPPTWGVLAEPGEEVSSIRFECSDGVYSFPYHALARWVLRPGEPAVLEIIAGEDEITVRGRELEVVRDALDSGRLRVLRRVSGRYAGTRTGTLITDLIVTARALPR